MLFKSIKDNLATLAVNGIDREREHLLESIANYVTKKQKEGKVPKLNFICTHNSRRSQLGQVMAKAAANYYGINVATYSGGTEATAFNVNAINALKQFGFVIEQNNETNPLVKVYYGANEPIECFSKVYDHELNAKTDFAAVMTCSDADKNCPVVLGAEARFSLKYNDPKASDGTGNESKVYYERLCQIAAEMLYIFGNVK